MLGDVVLGGAGEQIDVDASPTLERLDEPAHELDGIHRRAGALRVGGGNESQNRRDPRIRVARIRVALLEGSPHRSTRRRAEIVVDGQPVGLLRGAVPVSASAAGHAAYAFAAWMLSAAIAVSRSAIFPRRYSRSGCTPLAHVASAPTSPPKRSINSISSGLKRP